MTADARFLSVAKVARVFGVAKLTIYRAIREGEFPAVRVRGRLLIPTEAVDRMADDAIAKNALVDAADYVAPEVA